MNCIVTGGLGFIGSHLVDELVARGHQVYVVDNLSTGSKDNANSHAIYEINDILNYEWLSAFIHKINPDWVFHLAALPRIQPSYEDPHLHEDVNVKGTINIAQICSDNNLKLKALVYSSSSSVYGNPLHFPTDETERVDPLSPYALQKYAAERYLHIFSERYKFPVVSLRYFNPYGPRSFNKKNPFNAYTSVVGIFNNQAQSNQPLTITGDGLQERDFIHIKDLALANIVVAENIAMTNGNVYNVGRGKTISILNLAKLFNKPYVFIPERQGEAKVTHADITALSGLGWTPTISIEDAILSGNL